MSRPPKEHPQIVVRYWFYVCAVLSLLIIGFVAHFWPPIIWFLIIVLPLIALGLYDIFQTHHNILRNYPVWGHWRFLSLSIRPMIQRYFIEDNLNGKPFNHEQFQLVIERATKTLDTLPFGTQYDVRAVGYEWLTHSLNPKVVDKDSMRILIGNEQCKKPYLASRLNISAMSYGAISKNAVRALNRGAKIGGFYQNTGEGGLSQYHLSEGGDLVWQLGTACFGCRTEDGQFDPNLFREKAQLEQIKMIEVKLSQGAKPSHGGILPAAKITPEIAKIRNVKLGVDCVQPATNPECTTPIKLLEFLARLRELSGGKPVGFKLCIGRMHEFMAICKAMLKTGIIPDFITVDGAEGGTGAAPLEFSDRIGTPLNEGIIFVNSCLTGVNLKDKIRVIASGKVITGFDMLVKIALGADLCNSARGMLFAIGCVQSLRCNTNTCPTGVTTQDPARMYALKINEKAPRVHNFHEATIHSFMEVLGAAGIDHPAKLGPQYIFRRISENQALHYDEIYKFLTPGQLLSGIDLPPRYAKSWEKAVIEHF
ncbi:MAG: glutamate synthase [Gammaproteobacteria bacterium RIFCSPHIGHO2_12_FULL_35_23]|nr:MAG: glutamate synthase [Gammaproteobacteria bacterium RIFCSPHIGHO2_12_FULL_35_23]